jgi:hypothetical protein
MEGKLITLNEWGNLLVEASKTISKEKRASFAELMASLQKPVGARRNK